MHRYAVLLAILTLAACGKPPAPPAPGPPEVQVLTVAVEDLAADNSYVGRTVPNHTVELRARVTGTLLERPYKEGEPVDAGAVLFRLDPREFEAARDSAKARLAQAEAQVTRTAADLKRTEPLTKAGAASQADLDGAIASALAANADRDAARAQLAKAELDLSFSTITAPFAGMAGKSAVDPGALVSPSTGTLALLDQVDPIAVEFTVSEAELVSWRSDIAAGRMKVPLIDHLLVKATLVDGSQLAAEGRIAFRSVRIKPETGTALIRAVFPNTDGLMRAGQFIRLKVIGAVRVGVILVPQAAVLQTPTGASVYVLGNDGKAEVRKIELGSWRDDRWVVRSGLQAGDQIIVDGVQRVRTGAPVKASPWQPPVKDDQTPAPAAKP